MHVRLMSSTPRMGVHTERFMNNRQIRVRDTYNGAVDVLKDSNETLPKELLALMERLRGYVADIDNCVKEQTIAHVDAAVSHLRRRLNRLRSEQMLPLARFGLRLFAGDAGMLSALKVPHKQAPTDTILAAAALMAKAMAPHRALLKAEQFDPSRIGHLKRDAQLLKKEFEAAYASLADRAVPTRRLAALMRSARLEVRAMDALVAAHGSDLLRETWRDAIRVEKRMGRPRKRKTSAVAD